ncbi:hypothetical protein NKI25_32880 [Mesorhizobium sp. M0808]|uniref:DNA modification system-associated small protein n=1 Tax=Mesorhizobium sp. M0808 TaxID=2957002 RepID=UPI003338371C
MVEDDLTLETLLAVREDVAPYLDQDLLKQCYQIQKRFQFKDDRTVSTNGMDRLIDEALVAHSEAAKSN